MATTTTLSDRIEELKRRIGATDSDDERLDALSDLIMLLNRHDPGQAHAYARMAFRLARRRRDAWHQGHSLNSLGAVYVRRGDYRTGLSYFHRSLALFRAIGREIGEAGSCYSLGATYKEMGEYRKALEYATRAHRLSELHGKARVAAMVANQIGIINIRLARYDTALEYLLPALEYFHQEENGYWEGVVLHNIGMAYSELGDLAAAEEVSLRCREIRLGIGDHYGAALMAASIGDLLNSRGEYERALPFLREGYNALTAFPDNDDSIEVTLSLGVNHERRGDFPTAIACYIEALATAERIGKPLAQAHALVALGEAYLERGDHEVAAGYLSRCMAIAGEIGGPEIIYRTHYALFALHERTGDPARALEHYKLYNEIRAKVDQNGQQRRIARMLQRMDRERSERSEKVMRLEQEQLRMEVERKNRELAASAMQRCREHSFLKELEERMREIMAAGEAGMREMLPDLLRQIRQELSPGSEWEGFLRHFNDLYPEFLRDISRAHPGLSPTELRVCSLLKINLATKQIAEILCISPKSVEVYRARIRKKMGLDPETNLSTYLARI
jgi:tetratricopeptide (TPR) repeat protein/DNA-binding CsgD family transcriptional regulator